MNKFNHFLGIGVSKEYFDAVIMLNGNRKNSIHSQFENSSKGISSLCKWLKKLKSRPSDTLTCLEHTGIYSKLIVKHLIALDFPLWVQMSLKIIRSIGVQRGKSDKLDAEKIAYYALKYADEATLYNTPDVFIDRIRKLLALRDKLIKTKTSLLKNQKELEHFDKDLAKLSSKHQKNTIKGIDKDLKNIETNIDTLLKDDEDLERIYNQAKSVPGIGRITALYLICFTNRFTMYSTPRQLACYSGVVPFEYTSGKSVRAKPKVHYMANKILKKQLHMCALAAVTYDPEMKAYYSRKVKEGKHKMLVINNVRNKLVHRVCACIRENRMYELRKTA
jgi:transposase